MLRGQTEHCITISHLDWVLDHESRVPLQTAHEQTPIFRSEHRVKRGTRNLNDPDPTTYIQLSGEQLVVMEGNTTVRLQLWMLHLPPYIYIPIFEQRHGVIKPAAEVDRLPW